MESVFQKYKCLSLICLHPVTSGSYADKYKLKYVNRE